MLLSMSRALTIVVGLLLCSPAGRLHAQAAPSSPQQLRLQLQQVEKERAGTSNFLPWLTVGVGGTAVVGAAVAGTIHTFTCDNECSTPNWVAAAVVGGGLVAILGGLWVIHRDLYIRELESRSYQLHRSLEQFQPAAQMKRTREFARTPAMFTLKLRF